MIKARQVFLGFGPYRITELICDVCETPIVRESSFFGEVDFSSKHGAVNGLHCHVNCVDRFKDAQKVLTHGRSFSSEFVLPDWEKYLVTEREGEELRTLNDYFVDSCSGLVKKVVTCHVCSLAAVVALHPSQAEAIPEVAYYNAGSSYPREEASICSTYRGGFDPKHRFFSVEACRHDFMRLAQSGDENADAYKIVTETKAALLMGEYDAALMKMLRLSDDDVVSGAIEMAFGYSWSWCKKCGYVAKLKNEKRSCLPISGFASQEHGIGRYEGLHVTQTRFIGEQECRISE